MTGWNPGIETLYACEDYKPKTGWEGDVDPAACKHWWGRQDEGGRCCELGKKCLWSGRPPKNENDPTDLVGRVGFEPKTPRL